MSTLRVTNIQNPSAASPSIVLDSSGGMSGAFPSPNRNLLYNGAMQVHQRGTSTASITTGGYYTADRWRFNVQNFGTWTQTVENDAPTGSGFRKSLKVLCTTADAAPAGTDYATVIQLLEGQDLQRIAKGTSSAQQLTLSFWVKSNVTGTYSIMLYDVDNTRFTSFTYSISASATWEKKTILVPADTTGAFDNDNADSLQVYFNLGSGSTYTGGSPQTTWSASSAFATQWMPSQTNLAAATNNYWQITGVQLETGAVATPFEFKSYGQELRECQRYYYLAATGTGSESFAIGYNYSATVMDAIIHLPVTMRIAPVSACNSGTDYFAFYRNSASDLFNSITVLSNTSSRVVYIRNLTEINGTAGHAGMLFCNNTNAIVAFSAEL